MHGRLAAALTLIFKGPSGELELWRRTWPTMRDFELSMPLLWDDQLQENLPWRVQGMGLFFSSPLSLRFRGLARLNTVRHFTRLLL